MSKIYFVREQKVVIDSDLSEQYGVETRLLNEQVKRNISRFPDDFMFQLSGDEFKNLKSQIATSREVNGIQIASRFVPCGRNDGGWLFSWMRRGVGEN